MNPDPSSRRALVLAELDRRCRSIEKSHKGAVPESCWVSARSVAQELDLKTSVVWRILVTESWASAVHTREQNRRRVWWISRP